MKSIMRWGWAILALGTFLADQLSKAWMIHGLDLPHRAPLHLSPYFSLVMAWNKGVSFSMLNGGEAYMVWVLTMGAVLVSALLARLAMKSEKRLERVGYGLVIGGALGNTCDRVRIGAVADFFYAHIGDLGWPAFNVADMGICCGVGLLLISTLKPSAKGVG